MRFAVILISSLAIIGCAGDTVVQDSSPAAAKAKQACADGEVDCYALADELPEGVTTKAAKLLAENCKDPDLSKLVKGETLMLCDGTIGEGTYEAAAGGLPECSPDPWNVRYGVTVGGITGKLKVNCRNMVDTRTFDNKRDPARAGADVFDTIDDWNNDGNYPSTNPWSGGEAHLCGANDPTDPNWVRITTDPVTSGENSVFEDKITGLKWTRGDSTAVKTWDEVPGDAGIGAIEYCDGLDHGGTKTWRLPTQKELMTAYSNGIYDLNDGNTAANHLGNLEFKVWSSSTETDATGARWYVNLRSGFTFSIAKGFSGSVLCVSP